MKNHLIATLKKLCDKRNFGLTITMGQLIRQDNSVLDLGCGKSSPLRDLNLASTTGLDIHENTI